jgi:hypothetical protein
MLARARARSFQLMKYQQQAMQLDDERNSRSHTERQCVVIPQLDISNCVIISTLYDDQP